MRYTFAMPAFSLDSLIRCVTDYFRSHAGLYGLNAETVEARYILNWSGFSNTNFLIRDGIRDGGKRYHLKLANKDKNLARLGRWASLHKRLTECYHAPQMLDWVKIPGTSYQGPLFEYIPGQPADLVNQPEVLRGVLDLLTRLHADRRLAAELPMLNVNEAVETPATPSRTCADHFLDVYIARFDEDLIIIANDPPEFVPPDVLNWMVDETRKLEGLVRLLPAFQRPANSPTHGDLWQNNILVTKTGSWTIIDWDDLDLGDPALEYGILLGPLWRSGVLTLADTEGYLPPDPAPGAREDFLVRFRLSLRLLLLDEIIDTLADWVESGVAHDHRDEFRGKKKRTYREALEMYRRLYQENQPQ